MSKLKSYYFEELTREEYDEYEYEYNEWLNAQVMDTIEFDMMVEEMRYDYA